MRLLWELWKFQSGIGRLSLQGKGQKFGFRNFCGDLSKSKFLDNFIVKKMQNIKLIKNLTDLKGQNRSLEAIENFEVTPGISSIFECANFA